MTFDEKITSCEEVKEKADEVPQSRFFYNHIDLSPRHAGTLMGITNTFGAIPKIVAGHLFERLIPHKTAEEWNSVYYLGAAINLVGAIVYATFASGERQPWSYIKAELKRKLELMSTDVEAKSADCKEIE